MVTGVLTTGDVSPAPIGRARCKRQRDPEAGSSLSAEAIRMTAGVRGTAAAAPSHACGGAAQRSKPLEIVDTDDGVERPLGRGFNQCPHRTPGMASERQVTAVEDAGLFRCC